MIRMMNCDCMDFMASLPDKAYQLAIVDPPYGIGVAKMAYTQEDNRPCKQKNGSVLRVKKLKYKHGSWDNNIPPILYFDEIKRISINQIIWGWNYYNINWGNGIIKWNKLVPDGVSFSKYEYAYCSLIDSEIEFKYLWSGFSQGISLKKPTIQQGNKKLNETRIHPTQKPVALYKWLLKKYAKPGDRILDTHGGSGSIAIACYDLGFDLDWMELDKDYYKAAVERYDAHVAKYAPAHEHPVTKQGQSKLF